LLSDVKNGWEKKSAYLSPDGGAWSSFQ